MIMKNCNYSVYKHTTPNGKAYIGITYQNPLKRWKNGKGYITQMFYKAILKYGWDNIRHEILFAGLTKEEAEAKEIELIAFYKTNNPEFGYNIENGGNSIGKVAKEVKKKISETKKGKRHKEETRKKISQSLKGKRISEETRKKIGDASKGRRPTEETRKKMSEAQKGRISAMKGKHMPKEAREKIGKAQSVIVICVETGQVFNSIVEAQKRLGIRNICECCQGKRKTAGGFHWEYKNKGRK